MSTERHLVLCDFKEEGKNARFVGIENISNHHNWGQIVYLSDIKNALSGVEGLAMAVDLVPRKPWGKDDAVTSEIVAVHTLITHWEHPHERGVKEFALVNWDGYSINASGEVFLVRNDGWKSNVYCSDIYAAIRDIPKKEKFVVGLNPFDYPHNERVKTEIVNVFRLEKHWEKESQPDDSELIREHIEEFGEDEDC